VTNDWYQDFFTGTAVDFWMAAAPPPDEDIAFLQSVFARGGEILDVACGAGRHAIPLARAGYRVAGVDISADFLERARRVSDVAVEWHQRDMRDLPWSGRFDGALCFGNSFGYLGRSGTRASIASIADAMKPGARFVVDTGSIAESILTSLQQRRWIAVGDILFLSSATYDVNESRLDVEYPSFAATRARRRPRICRFSRPASFATCSMPADSRWNRCSRRRKGRYFVSGRRG
jgi:SAM-dependent methyltransferase